MTKFAALFRAVNYAGWPLLAIYGYCMYIHPWLVGDWQYVQEVWDRWQTLNAGAIAFLASLIALNIAKVTENSQREREFTAAKAYLPSTLSSLIHYFKQSAKTLATLWNPPIRNGALVTLPQLPNEYREVFSNCIKHAEPSVGSYLSNILVLLQVHEARLSEAVDSLQAENGVAVSRENLLAYLMRLGELYALIANFFDFARGDSPFEQKPLSWESFRTAYALLDLDAEEFFIDDKMNLIAFTQRWVARHHQSAVAVGQ